MTVQLLLGHGLLLVQVASGQALVESVAMVSQGSASRADLLRDHHRQCTSCGLIAGMGLLCLRLPELAMRHCSTIIIASRGQPRLPEQGRPVAGPPPWRALPAEAVCMTRRQYGLPDASPHARHSWVYRQYGQRRGSQGGSRRPCTLRSAL